MLVTAALRSFHGELSRRWIRFVDAESAIVATINFSPWNFIRRTSSWCVLLPLGFPSRSASLRRKLFVLTVCPATTRTRRQAQSLLSTGTSACPATLRQQISLRVHRQREHQHARNVICQKWRSTHTFALQITGSGSQVRFQMGQSQPLPLLPFIKSEPLKRGLCGAKLQSFGSSFSGG